MNHTGTTHTAPDGIRHIHERYDGERLTNADGRTFCGACELYLETVPDTVPPEQK